MVWGICFADFIWIFKNRGRGGGIKQTPSGSATAIIGPVKYLFENPHYRITTLILGYHTGIGEYCPKEGQFSPISV